MLRESAAIEKLGASAALDAGRAPPAQVLRLWPWLLPHQRLLVLAFVAIITAAGSVLLLGQGLRFVIDQGLGTSNPALLDYALLGLAGLVVILALASYWRIVLLARLSEAVAEKLRGDVLAHLVRLPLDFFDHHSSGNLVARFTNDISLIQVLLATAAPIAVRNIILLIGGLSLLLHSSPKLASVIFIFVPILVGLVFTLGRRLRGEARLAQDKIGDMGGVLQEMLLGMRSLRGMAAEGIFLRRFAQATQAARLASLAHSRRRALLAASILATVFAAVGTIFWLGGQAVLAGSLSAGSLSAFIFYAVLIAGAAGALTEISGDLQRAAGAADRLAELLAMAPAAHNGTSSWHGAGTIELRDVSFAYAARPEQPVLRGVNLTVPAGKTIALVGSSGSGKSTLFALLQAFYMPQQGQIRVDDTDLATLDIAAWRHQLGVVPQEPFLFTGSIADNIRLSLPEADDAAVEQAAREANALDFIQSFPDGMASLLGERGINLSGGQKQRIAIARALLRQPKILLLDEITSALDAESEAAIQQALDRLRHGRTTLIITHRLATAERADAIAVLEDGRIAAYGTHAELLASNPLYARLARLQLRG